MTKMLVSVRDEFDLYSGLKITELAEMYKDNPDAKLVVDAYYESYEIYVEYSRLETDKEYNVRLDREAKQKLTAAELAKKKRERALKIFNKLKQEHGFE